MAPNFLTRTSQTKRGTQETHLRWWVTLLMSIALSVGTWNPTGYHFIGYISGSENLLAGFTPFVILIMLALWMLAIKSIFQTLGFYGLLFTVIVILAFVWGLQQYGLVNVSDIGQVGWIVTIAVGFLIWFGLNASLIWKSLTGVYTTDSIEEE